MKKLVFAAVAALAMVSVSNVFAVRSANIDSSIEPNDTVVSSTTGAPADTAAAPADTVVAK